MPTGQGAVEDPDEEGDVTARRGRWWRLAAPVVLVAFAVGVGSNPAGAAAPSFGSEPPERLYTLVNTAIAFDDVQDPISGDYRNLDITATADDCNPVSPAFALGGCARVQLDVNAGTLAVDVSAKPAGYPWDRPTPGGAIVTDSTNNDGTGGSVSLNGDADQIDAALDTLAWTPPTDYANTDGTPAVLTVLVVDGNAPGDSVTHYVELRVDQVNDGPDLTVPAAPVNVAVDTEVYLPAVAPGINDLGDLSVADPDIEDVAGNKMLLVM